MEACLIASSSTAFDMPNILLSPPMIKPKDQREEKKNGSSLYHWSTHRDCGKQTAVLVEDRRQRGGRCSRCSGGGGVADSQA